MHKFVHRRRGVSPPILSALMWVCMGAAATPATAQSIDPHGTHATLGLPLSMEVRVRHADAPQAMLTPRCLDVELVVGDTHIGADELKVTLLPDPQPGWQRARLTSPTLLQEPLIQARITLRCGPPYTREFPVFGDPTAQPARHSSDLWVTAKNSGVVPKAMKPPVEGTLRRSVAAGFEAAAPEPGPVAPPSAASSAGLAAPVRPPDTASHPPASQWLLAELQRLQEKNRRTEIRLASLQAQLAQRDRNSGAHLWPWALVVLLLVLAGIGRIARDAWRSQRTVWQGLLNAGPSAQRPVRPTPPPVDDPQVPAPAPAAVPAADPTPVTAIAIARPVTDRRLRWPHADFGEASLENPPDPDYLRQLESYMEQGFPGATMVMVEKSLQATAHKNPWYLLIMLDLYSALSQRTNQEGVAAQLEALYNVQIPDAAGLPVEGRDLMEQPATLTQVCDCWRDPRAVDRLEALLLQPVVLENLDLAAFRDVLLLHAIATTNAAQDGAPADFNPLIDWPSPDA